MPDGVEHVRSVGPFDGWMRGAVTQFKYRGEWARVTDLGQLLAIVAGDLRPFDALVPVPLHPTRLRHRGFNQSFLLAQQAAKILDVPVEEILMRTRRTTAQVHLGAEERFGNVNGAMAAKPGSRVTGRSFVVIDDVITTGSTIAACAAALIQAGAQSVKAATITREM